MIWTKAYRPFALLLLLDTTVSLLDKQASTRAQGSGAAFYTSLLNHSWLWMALALRPVQLVVWTRILRKTDLSLAYSLTSLSYPLTMLCAVVLFHERLPGPVWFGAALITIGVACLAEPQHPTLVEVIP
jgi:drug/metabolite transporter (DMT)-like permease